MVSKKRPPKYLWGKHIQQKEGEEKEGFGLVSLDESFFFYDSLARRVWVDKEKVPIVMVTGTHQHLCLFGAMDIEGKQLFRHVLDSTANTLQVS